MSTRPMMIAAALLLLMSDAASAQQRQFYDAAGRNAGRAVTDTQGSTTFYGPDGRVTGRATGRAQDRQPAAGQRPSSR